VLVQPLLVEQTDEYCADGTRAPWIHCAPAATGEQCANISADHAKTETRAGSNCSPNLGWAPAIFVGMGVPLLVAGRRGPRLLPPQAHGSHTAGASGCLGSRGVRGKSLPGGVNSILNMKVFLLAAAGSGNYRCLKASVLLSVNETW
jgi:hypothetical protein